MEAPPRLELGNKGFADLCLTTWLWRHLTSASRETLFFLSAPLVLQRLLCGYNHWSGLRGSNPPPRPWQGRALPNELNPQVTAHFYTGWCLRSELNQRHGDFQSPALPTELQRRKQEHMPLFQKSGDPDGARTHDLQRDRLAF